MPSQRRTASRSAAHAPPRQRAPSSRSSARSPEARLQGPPAAAPSQEGPPPAPASPPAPAVHPARSAGAADSSTHAPAPPESTQPHMHRGAASESHGFPDGRTTNGDDGPVFEIDETGVTHLEGDKLLTTMQFTEQNLLPETERALSDVLHLTHLTEVQARALPYALAGRDVLAAARTGSGKTLAFLVPAVEMLARLRFRAHNGTGVIAIAPTRELALQIYAVARNMLKFHTGITHGVVIGQGNLAVERRRLERGVNLLVGTPGRLLDHLEHTAHFSVRHLKLLIVDETDRILEAGFSRQIFRIIQQLPSVRQTVMFSATQTRDVADLARLSLRGTRPVYVAVGDPDTAATVSSLEQGYVICPSHLRFRLLYAFAKRNRKRKTVVFFSTCNAVAFHTQVFQLVGLTCWELHGRLNQTQRTQAYVAFSRATTGVLLTTDVAARGLDIPGIDWVIQYDPPDDPRDYIHRVGRTARAGMDGRAVLFLLPSELGFLVYLREARVPLNEYAFPTDRVADIQASLEHLVGQHHALYRLAKLAFQSYIQAYAVHRHRDVFDVSQLDLNKACRAFGFSVPPRVHFGLSPALGERRRRS